MAWSITQRRHSVNYKSDKKKTTLSVSHRSEMSPFIQKATRSHFRAKNAYFFAASSGGLVSESDRGSDKYPPLAPGAYSDTLGPLPEAVRPMILEALPAAGGVGAAKGGSVTRVIA